MFQSGTGSTREFVNLVETEIPVDACPGFEALSERNPGCGPNPEVLS